MRPLESAAIDPASGRIVLYDGHRLALFAPDDKGKYAELKDLPFERKLAGKAVLAGDSVFLVLDGEVRRYGGDLKLLDTLPAPTTSPPQAVRVSPDGHIVAVVYRDGQLWLYDAADKKPLGISVAGQGDVSAVAFGDEAMYVADRLTRVTKYELPTGKVEERWQGRAAAGGKNLSLRAASAVHRVSQTRPTQPDGDLPADIEGRHAGRDTARRWQRRAPRSWTCGGRSGATRCSW